MLATDKFTGKERDSETGLDYFGARYYGSTMGRFSTPDPKMFSSKRLYDPQQWNMFSYVRNNPLLYIDPDGKDLHIYIVDRTTLPSSVVGRAASGIAKNFREANVGNVTVTYADSVPDNVRRDIGVPKDVVYLELQQNHNGDVRIGAGASEQNPGGLIDTVTMGAVKKNTGPGGSAAAVEVNDPSVIPANSTDQEKADGITAYGTHGIAHKYLEGDPNAGSDDIMSHGQQPLSNVPFNEKEKKQLQKELNTEKKTNESQN